MSTVRTITSTAAATVLTLMGLAGAGCENQNWNVKRTEPNASTDITPHFNDEDARQIFQGMSDDMLSRPWVDNWRREHNGKDPIVFLGNVKNNTQEYISTQLFTNQIKDEMINSGKIVVKAEQQARQELRDERLDTKYNDPSTIKAVAKELNADYALVGSIDENVQRSENGRTVVSYYQAHMELIDVETARIVWSDTKEIKKVATR